MRKQQRILMRIHTIDITRKHLKSLKIIDFPLFLTSLLFTICLRKVSYHLTIDDYNNLSLNQNMNTQRINDSIETDGFGENMVKQLITKQFLENLKQEIGQKVKPSKSILEALRHSNTLNLNYKKTIQQLNNRINSLNEQNTGLKSKIEKIQQDLRNMAPQDQNNISHKSSSILSVNICDHTQYEQLIETLKQKIQCLQQSKRIKQIKITELLQKQVQYVGQINLLQYKNKQLQQRLVQMKQGIQQTVKTKKRTSQMNSSECNRKGSDNSQNFKIYINQQDSIKSDNSIAQLKQIQYLIAPKENNNRSMLVSCTEVVDIQQSYNIDNLAQKSRKALKKDEFNQIDYIIGEEMPYIKTQSHINSQKQGFKSGNINTSIIAINMNFPTG